MSTFVGAIGGSGDGAVQALRRISSATTDGDSGPVRQLAEAAQVREKRLSETQAPLPPPESQALQQGSPQSLQHGEPTTLVHDEPSRSGRHVDTYA